MDQEVSVVARKLENFFEPQVDHKTESKDVGFMRHIACVVILSLAVLLTKASLSLTRLVKKIEG